MIPLWVKLAGMWVGKKATILLLAKVRVPFANSHARYITLNTVVWLFPLVSSLHEGFPWMASRFAQDTSTTQAAKHISSSSQYPAPSATNL